MSIKRKKIALIGAGQIGGILAMLCTLRNLGDVVLYDVVEGLPQGKALDLSHMAPVLGCDCAITGTNRIEEIRDADVCIVTSGLPRKPGMSRDHLVKTNAAIIRQIAAAIREYARQSFVIVITNPLDAMVYLMQKESGLPSSHVAGMAGVLDGARYQAFLSSQLGVSASSISALVLGGHGDDMVPVRSCTSLAGAPIETQAPAAVLDAVEKRVRGAGGEIVSLLKTGSAFFSPAAAAIVMAESYLFDRKKPLAAAAFCEGQYGIEGLYVGVPVIIGSRGVEKILEIELNEDEAAALKKSVEAVRGLIALL